MSLILKGKGLICVVYHQYTYYQVDAKVDAATSVAEVIKSDVIDCIKVDSGI